MSGPKVVRVVTRKELVAIGRRDLAKVNQIHECWKKTLSSFGVVGEGDLEHVKNRISRLHTLLETDKFNELSTQCDLEIDFLHQDIERRIEKESVRRANSRAATQRLVATAETLLVQLKERSTTNSTGLISKLGDIACGSQNDLAQSNDIFNAVFAELSMDSRSVQQVATTAQRSLAEALGAEKTNDLNFQDWLEASQFGGETLQDRINRDIARLDGEFGAAVAEPYVARLEKILEHSSASQQRMMADTLALDLAKDSTNRKRSAALLLELDLVAAELTVFESEDCSAALNELRIARETNNDEALQEAIKCGRGVLDATAEKFAAQSSREAILSELKNLGYEIQEGMLAQLAIAGQLVLTNPSDINYGVELSAPPGNKIQVRMVAFEDSTVVNDAVKDESMETAWCGELVSIARELKAQGSELDIEIAKGAGELPLKRVSRSAPPAAEDVEVYVPKARQLRSPK